MKTWHRWVLFALAVPCFILGMWAMHEAFWYIDALARIRMFAGGVMIFGCGIALIAGAAMEEQ